MQRAYKIWLSQEQEDDLQRFARSRSLSARLAERSKMLLLCAAGHTVEQTAGQLGVVRQTVSRWLRRYIEQGWAGVEKDAPRSGRPPLILPSKIAEIVEKTTQQRPAGSTHWSTRTMVSHRGSERFERATNLACAWFAAAPGEELQA